jgi:hypothetical protein
VTADTEGQVEERAEKEKEEKSDDHSAIRGLLYPTHRSGQELYNVRSAVPHSRSCSRWNILYSAIQV